METNKELRGEIQDIGLSGLKLIRNYFNGDPVTDDKKIKNAITLAQLATKIEHMNQIKTQGDKSLALRLVKFLSPEVRDEYLKITNPEIKPLLLLDKPKKKKK